MPVFHQKSFQKLTTDELYELLRVRSEVFVVEQNCVYQDMDNDDQKSIHLWLTVANKVVAPRRPWLDFNIKNYTIMDLRLFWACVMLCVMTACVHGQSNDIVTEGENPVRVSDSYSFTEGPAADAKGDVYFTDQPNNRIYRWDCETGKITLFTDQSGRSNGMYFDAQGNLIACADMDNQLWSFDKDGHPSILITDYREKLLNGPNDVWISFPLSREAHTIEITSI